MQTEWMSRASACTLLAFFVAVRCCFLQLISLAVEIDGLLMSAPQNFKMWTGEGQATEINRNYAGKWRQNIFIHIISELATHTTMAQQHFVCALANEQVRQIGSHVVEQGNFMDQCFRLASLSAPYSAITSERFEMAPTKHVAPHTRSPHHNSTMLILHAIAIISMYSRLHESF